MNLIKKSGDYIIDLLNRYYGATLELGAAFDSVFRQFPASIWKLTNSVEIEKKKSVKNLEKKIEIKKKKSRKSNQERKNAKKI